ncbi:MAG: hypothetical protein Q6373_008725 [Candidatus Sigynarchaeota archaeon]
MQKSKRTTLLLLSVIAVSAVVVPGLYMNAAKADVTPQQFTDFGSLFTDPTSAGSTIGSMLGGIEGFKGNVLGNIFTLMFKQVLNFEEQEMLPGKNVYVFSANASQLNSSTITRSGSEYYSTYVPYRDNLGNQYWVAVNRSYNVQITFRQEALVVLILWDDDGSLVAAIKRVLAVVREAMAYAEEYEATHGPGSRVEFPQELVEKGAELITWMLVHINDIITGDEQIIFQPSYYWSYHLHGSFIETKTWYNYSSPSPYTPIGKPSLSIFPAGAQDDDFMEYLTGADINEPNADFYDSGFLFHLFQLWLQRFQISINMSKLGALIGWGQDGGNVTGDMLGNLLEGVDIKFTFTQHHLLGGALYEDLDPDGAGPLLPDGKPTVTYETTNWQYTDANGTKNVTLPQTNEFRYKLDLNSTGDPWIMNSPARVGNAVKWSVQFNNPTLKAIPIGMDDYEAGLGGYAIPLSTTMLKFGFTFEPSFEDVPVPDGSGNVVKTVRLGKGTVKLDQEFGTFNGGTLPVALQGLDLAVVYFSHIFKFDFSYRSEANPDVSEETEWYERADGTLDFLDSSSADYFGQIDIAGPNYQTRSNSYPASTSIIPFALFQFTYEAERNIANDDFSISQGESAFRTQSLYLDISSAWAFYCVSYPEWDGSALVHDPTFSIFMTLDTEVPWAVILLVVTIGALVGASILIYLKKQGRF